MASMDRMSRTAWRTMPSCARSITSASPLSARGGADPGGDLDLDLHAGLDHLNDQHRGGGADILEDGADGGNHCIHIGAVAHIIDHPDRILDGGAGLPQGLVDGG